MIFYVFKFMRIWSIFALITLSFSILLMFCGNNIFKKANKRAELSYLPIYNLLILLDVCNMFRLYFILLLLPIVNVLVIMLMLYRLSIVFLTKKGFALGLILMPIIFLPILNYSKNLKLSNEPSEEEKDISDNMVSMLTQEQYNELNKTEKEEPAIDNVFKAPKIDVAPPPAFKANVIKYKQMVVEEKPQIIEKVEPVKVNDLYANRFINTQNKQEEDETIEIVEL
ncbi:MAG: hypothetical protein HFE04_01570 [Bacilli bacterium]|nr:hypothetical protein [Bacilli bacterium]